MNYDIRRAQRNWVRCPNQTFALQIDALRVDQPRSADLGNLEGVQATLLVLSSGVMPRSLHAEFAKTELMAAGHDDLHRRWRTPAAVSAAVIGPRLVGARNGTCD